MKAISVRFNAYQNYWLKIQAQVRGIHSADYVRELIEKQMKEPHFFEYFKEAEAKIMMPAADKKIILYSLITCKLMEQLILNEEDGQQKCEMAYLAAEEQFGALKVYDSRKKFYRLNLMLFPEQLAWINEQAKIIKKTPLAIIRKIVFLASSYTAQETTNLRVNTSLMEVQKEELKAILMTFTILKAYIMNTYEGGEKLIKSAQESAEVLYNKLYMA